MPLWKQAPVRPASLCGPWVIRPSLPAASCQPPLARRRRALPATASQEGEEGASLPSTRHVRHTRDDTCAWRNSADWEPMAPIGARTGLGIRQ